MSSPPIQVKDLRVQYRAKGRQLDAVQGLSFEVHSGEVVGFLGPNGAGKSSTLKAIMGFVPLAAGECRIFGEPAGTAESRKQVGYLPEVALYYPYLTPLETLALYGELQGLRGQSLRKEAERLLEALNIAGSMKTQNRLLSKGMLQRVGICQSLLGSPKLLILDEVTSGLDPLGRQELRGILKERQAAGSTLFFSSHELAEVDMLCDRVLIINQGRLIIERQISDLKASLRRFHLVYSGDASMLGLSEDWNESRPGLKEAKFQDKPTLLKALQRVADSHGEVVDVTTQEGSLEDYFIKTVEASS